MKEMAVMPQPNNMRFATGYCSLNTNGFVYIENELELVYPEFIQALNKTLETGLKKNADASECNVVVKYIKTEDLKEINGAFHTEYKIEQLKNESYYVNILNNKIIIAAIDKTIGI